MIALLMGPLGKWLGGAAIIIAAVIGFKVWLVAHDKAVLSGYVALSEKTAAEAKAAEQKRQADAATQALKTANDKIATAKAAEAKATADLDKRISDYEQKLAAAKRDCLADNDDIDFILHDGKPASSPLGHH